MGEDATIAAALADEDTDVESLSSRKRRARRAAAERGPAVASVEALQAYIRREGREV